MAGASAMCASCEPSAPNQKCLNALADLHAVTAASLTPAMIKHWITAATIATKTTRNILSFLRAAMDEAVTDGLLPINPVSQVSVGRYKGTELASDVSAREVDPFTPDEVAAIILAARNEQWAALFRFAFATGLRSSELCALRWEHIDWVGHHVAVQAARIDGIDKQTKTRAGTRSVELDADALAALLDQKRFTFLHSPFVFHDPKTNQPWSGAAYLNEVLHTWKYRNLTPDRKSRFTGNSGMPPHCVGTPGFRSGRCPLACVRHCAPGS